VVGVQKGQSQHTVGGKKASLNPGQYSSTKGQRLVGANRVNYATHSRKGEPGSTKTNRLLEKHEVRVFRGRESQNSPLVNLVRFYEDKKRKTAAQARGTLLREENALQQKFLKKAPEKQKLAKRHPHVTKTESFLGSGTRKRRPVYCTAKGCRSWPIPPKTRSEEYTRSKVPSGLVLRAKKMWDAWHRVKKKGVSSTSGKTRSGEKPGNKTRVQRQKT